MSPLNNFLQFLGESVIVPVRSHYWLSRSRLNGEKRSRRAQNTVAGASEHYLDYGHAHGNRAA